IFDFAINQLNGAEFAGATFSPDGQTLYVNIQGPTSGSPAEGAGQGLTCAIWGPWRRGAL
ncbi:MAG: alkaline phosphatase PhoX, partial [Longimicrobiales bacterium]